MQCGIGNLYKAKYASTRLRANKAWTKMQERLYFVLGVLDMIGSKKLKKI